MRPGARTLPYWHQAPIEALAHTWHADVLLTPSSVACRVGQLLLDGMPAINAETSSDDGGGVPESDDPISATELEGYAREGSSSGQEEEVRDVAELHEYARSLGLDPEVHADLMWVALEAFTARLPSGWTDHVDSEGRVYFCNEVTQESSWFHPTDALFREVLELVMALRAERPPPSEARRGAAIRDHLVRAHREAQAQLDGWSGPYDSEQGPYYYNRILDVSHWENPVEDSERALDTRQRVLRRCLLAEWPDSSPRSPEDSRGSAAAQSPLGSSAPETALGLTAPSPGSALPRSPSSARSFHTARSAGTARSGRSPRRAFTSSRALSPSTLPSRSTTVSPSHSRASPTRSRAAAPGAASPPPPEGSEVSNLQSLLKPILPQPSADVEVTGWPSASSRSPARSPERSPVQPPERSPAQRVERSPVRSPGRPCEASVAPPLAQPPLRARQFLASQSGTVVAEQAAVAAQPEDAAPAGKCQRPAEAVFQGAERSSSQVAPAGDVQAFDLAAAISEFARDASRKSLELPLGLSAEQRKRAKALVEQHTGLKCESFGFGAERRMHVFREAAAQEDKLEPPSDVGQPDNEENVEFTFGAADNLEIPKVGD